MSNIKGIGHGGHHVPPSADGSGGPPGRAVGLRDGAAGRIPGAQDPASDPARLLAQLSQTSSPVEVPRPLPPDLVRQPPTQPDPRQGYNPQALLNTDAQLRGEGTLVSRPVQELVPDLHQAQTLSEVRERFSSDYALLKRQIVDVPQLPPEDKAQRAFQFFSAYAARFVAVATGEPQQLPQNPDPTQLPEGTFEREAPVQATGEGEQLWGEGDGEGEDADAGEVGGKLGQLLQRASRGLRQEAAARSAAREGKEGPQLSDGTPFGGFSGAASGPQTPDRAQTRSELQAFAQTLKDLHFGEMRDASTGKNGLQLAYELLTSKSPEETERKADDVRIRSEEWPPVPPSTDGAPEEPASVPNPNDRPKVKQDLGMSRPELDYAVEFERQNGMPEPMRVQPLAVEAAKVIIQPPAMELSPRELEGDDRSFLGKLTDKKLGRNMLWNVLHRFRGRGEDSAVNKGEWDKLTFAAICVLALIFLIVAALVAL